MDFHFFGHGKSWKINVEKVGAPWCVRSSILDLGSAMGETDRRWPSVHYVPAVWGWGHTVFHLYCVAFAGCTFPQHITFLLAVCIPLPQQHKNIWQETYSGESTTTCVWGAYNLCQVTNGMFDTADWEQSAIMSSALLHNLVWND